MKQYRLCYIDGNTAYFTDQFDHQWGDDWNDAPYEHNAGRPYRDVTIDGVKHPAEIVRLGFREHGSHVEFDTPASKANHSSAYSVQDMNNHRTPWLSARLPGGNYQHLPAGATVGEFVDFIIGHGGALQMEWHT